VERSTFKGEVSIGGISKAEQPSLLKPIGKEDALDESHKSVKKELPNFNVDDSVRKVQIKGHVSNLRFRGSLFRGWRLNSSHAKVKFATKSKHSRINRRTRGKIIIRHRGQFQRSKVELRD
jgi:hypothetical protein